MATSTTPETINGKTLRHSQGIHNARMDAISAILGKDFDALLVAWNDLNEQAEELIALQRAQINLLEALCRHRDTKREEAFRAFNPGDHEPEECGSHCQLHRKFGTCGREW